MFAYACIHAEDNLLDISFDLTDKEGILAAKMKIDLRISGSVDNIEEFMKKVDDDVGLMSSLPRNLSTLGQILKLTKDIIDKVSQVRDLLSLNLINRLIEVFRHTRYSLYRGPLFPVFIRLIILLSVKHLI